MKTVRFFLTSSLLAVVASSLGGCSKPAPPASAEQSAIDPAAPAPPPTMTAPAETNPPAMTMGERVPASPTPPVEEVPISELEKRYPAADQEGRSALIEDISDRDDPAVAPALLRLFQMEQNVELQGEILSTMSVVEGQVETKLQAVRLGLAAPQQEVKEGALDLLGSVEDPAAIPLWQRLTQSPDADTRELAKEMIETLTGTPAATP